MMISVAVSVRMSMRTVLIIAGMEYRRFDMPNTSRLLSPALLVGKNSSVAALYWMYVEIWP